MSYVSPYGVSEPGIYLLQHLPTGRFYVGASMQLYVRRPAWLALLKRCCSDAVGPRSVGLSRAFREFIAETDFEDWRMFCIEWLPGAGREYLLEAEARHLRRARADARCFNKGFAKGSRKIGSVQRTYLPAGRF